MTAAAKATRMVRDEGLRATLFALRSVAGQWWRQGEIWEFQKSSYVRLDGCRIALEREYPAPLLSLLKTAMYELPERVAISRYLNPDLPVIELGASIGVVACTTNRRLHRKDQHVVVEANPSLIPHLAANHRRNRCGFEILHRALAYGSESVDLWFNSGNPLATSAYVNGGATVRVETVTLEQIFQRRSFEIATLICDVEGSEFDLISKEAPLLAQRVGLLILELHERLLGPDRTRQVWERLTTIGFRLMHSQHETHVFMNEAAESQPRGSRQAAQ